MMSALAVDETMEVPATVTNTARYKVSVYLQGSDEPLTFDVGSPTLATEAIEWTKEDPRVTSITVTDMATNRRLACWPL